MKGELARGKRAKESTGRQEERDEGDPRGPKKKEEEEGEKENKENKRKEEQRGRQENKKTEKETRDSINQGQRKICETHAAPIRPPSTT
ncbi:hypothetical protein U1Q18_041329, partial [Sarracenia purpurea var. burkii]